MLKKVHRLVWAGTVALVVAFIVLNILAYNHAGAMMHFTKGGSRTRKPEALAFWEKAGVLLVGVNIPRPEGTAVPSDVGLPFENLSIPSRNGVRLAAWYVPNGKENALVILFHGYVAEKSAMLTEAQAFHRLGHPALLVDLRGSGDSSESYTTIGYHEAEDVTRVVQYAGDNLPHSKLVLFGQSMGAVAILRAVSQYGVAPDAIIVEAVFDTMLNTVKNRFKAMGVPSFPSAHLLLFWGGRRVGFDGFSHNPVEYARDVSCPVLFMHGVDDPRAQLEEGRRVFEAVPGQKQFREFPEAGHEAYCAKFPQAWEQMVREFLAEVANGSEPTAPLRRSEE